jgi:hypothetical protein
VKPERYNHKDPGRYRLMRRCSYFIAKERKSISLHTNSFKPITSVSINKDTIFRNKIFLKYLNTTSDGRSLCLNCTYSTPFGFTSIRFQIFTRLQQDDQYVDYNQRTAKFATINVQTQQKI